MTVLPYSNPVTGTLVAPATRGAYSAPVTGTTTAPVTTGIYSVPVTGTLNPPAPIGPYSRPVTGTLDALDVSPWFGKTSTGWVRLNALGISTGSTIPARSADSFVDATGIQTHFRFTAYSGRKAAIISAVQDLGVRWVRDSFGASNADGNAAIPLLASAGLKLLAAHSPNNTANVESQAAIQAIADWYAGLNAPLLAVEGWNEPGNVETTAGLAARVNAWQLWLWNVYNATAPFTTLPILGSALANPSAAAQWDLLTFSDRADAAALHDYPGASYDFDDADYTLFESNASLAVPNGRRWATETGHTQGQVGATYTVPSEAVTAVIVTRQLVEHFRRGWERTSIYELVDQGTDGTFEFGFGLLHNDLTPKPAYTAVKNLLALLADPGAAFTVAPLAGAITAGNSATRYVVLQKRNGTHWLLLWQQADLPSPTVLPNLSVGVTLTVNSSRTLDRYDPYTSTTSQATTTGTTFSLTASEKVKVYRLT